MTRTSTNQERERRKKKKNKHRNRTLDQAATQQNDSLHPPSHDGNAGRGGAAMMTSTSPIPAPIIPLCTPRVKAEHIATPGTSSSKQKKDKTGNHALVTPQTQSTLTSGIIPGSSVVGGGGISVEQSDDILVTQHVEYLRTHSVMDLLNLVVRGIAIYEHEKARLEE